MMDLDTRIGILSELTIIMNAQDSDDFDSAVEAIVKLCEVETNQSLREASVKV